MSGVLYIPSNGANVGDVISIDLEWTDAGGPVGSWQLQIATDVGFTNIVYNNVFAVSYGTVTLPGNATYYWKVKWIDQSWSSAWSFTVNTNLFNYLADREQPESIELYTFTSGATKYYYTSHFYQFFNSSDGQNYLPIPLQRSDFTLDSSLSDMTIDISCAASDLLSWLPVAIKNQNVAIEIRRWFTADLSSSLLVFRGTISEVDGENGILDINCASFTDLFTKNIPRVYFQSSCNNQLFDSVCGLVAASFAKTCTLSNIADAVLTSTGFATPTPPVGQPTWWQYGKCLWNGQIRFITGQSGNTITLSYAFDGIALPASVVVYPGCDKLPATCAGSKFNNFTKFVGAPYIPMKDPVAKPVQQYNLNGTSI